MCIYVLMTDLFIHFNHRKKQKNLRDIYDKSKTFVIMGKKNVVVTAVF